MIVVDDKSSPRIGLRRAEPHQTLRKQRRYSPALTLSEDAGGGDRISTGSLCATDKRLCISQAPSITLCASEYDILYIVLIISRSKDASLLHYAHNVVSLTEKNMPVFQHLLLLVVEVVELRYAVFKFE